MIVAVSPYVVGKQVCLGSGVLPRAQPKFPRRGEPSKYFFDPIFALLPIEGAATPQSRLIVSASRCSVTDTAASDPVRRSIRIETIVRRVCRARISAASAWASMPGTSHSMPAARPELACGVLALSMLVAQMPTTACRGISAFSPF